MIKEQWEIAWKDYYRVLQVDERAEVEVIEGAYRKTRPEVPPRPGGNNADPERIKLINEAHEILGDPDRRRAYDRVYRVRKGRTAPAPPRPPVFQQAGQEFFEKTEEARKVAHEADEKVTEAHQEVETARQAFREAEKRMEEARAAAMIARKTLGTLEEQAAEARQEVTEARNRSGRPKEPRRRHGKKPRTSGRRPAKPRRRNAMPGRPWRRPGDRPWTPSGR